MWREEMFLQRCESCTILYTATGSAKENRGVDGYHTLKQHVTHITYQHLIIKPFVA